MNTVLAAVTGTVQAWVWLYTLGLPSELREARRAEVRSDLWEHINELRNTGESRFAIAREVLGRLLRGLPSDLSWRVRRHQAVHFEPLGPITFHGAMEAVQPEFYRLLMEEFSKDQEFSESPGVRTLLYLLEHPHSTISEVAAVTGDINEVGEAVVEWLKLLNEESLIHVRQGPRGIEVEGSPTLFPKRDTPYGTGDILKAQFAAYDRHQRAEQNKIRQTKRMHAFVLYDLRWFPNSSATEIIQRREAPEMDVKEILQELEEEGLILASEESQPRFCVNPRKFYAPFQHFTFEQAMEDILASAWGA